MRNIPKPQPANETQRKIVEWLDTHRGLDIATAEFLCCRDCNCSKQEFDAGYQFWVLAAD